MAAFLETMACRGAGLSPGGDTPLALPRPRARFESGIGTSPGLDAMAQAYEIAGNAEAAPDPQFRFESPPAAIDNGAYSPAPPTQDTPPGGQQGQRSVSRETTRPMSPELREVPQASVLRVSVEAAPESQTPARRAAPQFESLTSEEATRFDFRMAKTKEDPELVKPLATAAEARTRRTTDRSVQALVPDRASEPASVRATAQGGRISTADVQVDTPGLERLPLAEAYRQQGQLRSVSVSIGRIDVEVVSPPQAPVSTPRAQPERTRGFATYRNARRGRRR